MRDPSQVDDDASALIPVDGDCVLVGIPNKLATVLFTNRRIHLIDQPGHISAVARLLDFGAEKWRQMVLHEAKCDLRSIADDPQFLCR